MTLGFILNGEDVAIKSDAKKRLVDILRDKFGLLETKSGCNIGQCGACSIILNGEVFKSCLIPAFKIQGCEIITIEGFAQTDEYQDIVLGFSEAGVENCGFCSTAKILNIEALLGKNRNPEVEEILPMFSGVKCRCIEPTELIRGVLAVAECRRRRLYG